MKTVLIADDSKFMRTWLRRILQSYGYHVIAEAKNGMEVIEKYKKLRPDVVILDITMPKVDGLTALNEIINLDSNARVYMCSSLATQANVIQAIQHGAKDFIVKPYFDNLIDIINK